MIHRVGSRACRPAPQEQAVARLAAPVALRLLLLFLRYLQQALQSHHRHQLPRRSLSQLHLCRSRCRTLLWDNEPAGNVSDRPRDIGLSMTREWYLIIGLAKTGTTAVAMTLRNTLQIEGFCMEPRDLAKIEAETDERLVIKMLFDHWVDRVEMLEEFLRDPKTGGMTTTIAIVRDPRDEAISRLHYAAYNYFSARPTSEQDRLDWLEIFYRKEATPNSARSRQIRAARRRRYSRRRSCRRSPAEVDQVDLVHRQHDVADAEQRADEGVPPGLDEHALARVDQDDGEIGSWRRRSPCCACIARGPACRRR